STAAYAHSGGLDAQGGHNDRAAGTYHFHQGPLAGETFATKEEATEALLGEVGESPPVDLPSPQLPPVPPGQIRLASFNIRIYSTGSRNDTELGLIADRLQQFDLVAIQELRDEEVVQRTLSILEARGHLYHALVSPPVGRGVKERYAFLWRPEKVAPLDSGTVYPDPEDVFIREPFYASFRAGSFDFTLITIHVIFGDGVADRRAENLLLDDVYRAVQDADPNEQDVILLGDFNLPPSDSGMVEIDVLLDPVFTGDVRTTISETSLYDNLWWDAEFVTEWTGVAGIDRFDEAVFGNDDDAASLAVSDHRPIWVTLFTELPDDDGPSVSTGITPKRWGNAKLAR
ncbi:MAG: YHYH domain-containing protein, partial [Chloroflexi bacterium]|nr:YHYH domain-containing protein [Chloroflexota bacterium]